MIYDRSIVSSSYINGFWGSWKPIFDSGHIGINGTINDFYFYDNYLHPSEWGSHFVIIGLKNKSSIKSNHTYEYSGYIEYYSVHNHSSDVAKELTEGANSGYGPWLTTRPAVGGSKHKLYSKVLVYKKSGKLYYNFFFNNVGIGLGLPIS